MSDRSHLIESLPCAKPQGHQHAKVPSWRRYLSRKWRVYDYKRGISTGVEGMPVAFPGEGTFEFIPEPQVGFGIGSCRVKLFPLWGKK